MIHKFVSPAVDANNPAIVGSNAWNQEHVQNIVALSANTILSTTYDTILASGTIALTLPDATTCKGLGYLFKNVGSGTITINTFGAYQTIDGNLTATLTVTNQTLAVFSDGMNWDIADVVNYSSVRVIDGIKFPRTAAGINAAVADIGATTPGIIFVPYAGTYSDALIAIGAGHVLIFGAGTFVVAGITGPDSTTADVTWSVQGQGPALTVIQLANSANVDVIADANFSSFHSGTNFYGTFSVYITNLTVDGNKANQSGASYGVRLYGRRYKFANLVVQNAYSDGIYVEWGGTESDTSAGTDIEA